MQDIHSSIFLDGLVLLRTAVCILRAECGRELVKAARNPLLCMYAPQSQREQAPKMHCSTHF